MSDVVNDLKERYKAWVTENLGEKTGKWYTPYLERLGYLLDKYGLASGYKENFFEYQSYLEFKNIYQQMTEQSDEDIERLVAGKSTPRYPEKYGTTRIQFRKKYAEDEFNLGERSKPDNLGGIPDWGVLMRSYLIFLYYYENPTLTYPKKEKKIVNQEEEIDNSINYWVISPGEYSRLWDQFHAQNMIALGWDYLGDLKNYDSKEAVERKITEQRADGVRPVNDSKAVWDFYSEMQTGDIVYVKEGIKRILARGVVTGDYYFDNEALEYKHRRRVEWHQVGKRELHQTLAQKTLTCLNSYPNLIQEIDRVMNEDLIDPKDAEVNEFRIWLSNQVTDTGDSLNDKTVTQKVNALKDIERHFDVSIFGETDIEQLKQLKDVVISDESHKKYKGVSGSSIDYYIRFIESKPTVQENESFTMDEFLSKVFIDKKELVSLISLLKNKKNLILKGAPGVGKTFIAKRLAHVMMGEKDETRIHMVQFHQSYSYEDFIEGFRPKAEGEGFELKQGPFVKFARKAERDPERDYFFIIDEINRGNMSKIFGELMMLIEADKRDVQINLLYSNDKFSVPPNLYIIGMMNTADRSLALLDYALRRRFSFFEIKPAFQNETFQSYVNELDNPEALNRVIDEIKSLNNQIIEELGAGFQIGHSYFIGDAYKVDILNRVKEVIEFEIIPQLFEYWFDDEQKANDWAERLRGCYDGEK
ncbi:AAA family ATPase [Virgibacillus halodenitrificans]|uniref:AAA family ATPase n=1 Tax=Virgibacillus halodenitrificans TaxID=1482 RepID=UPI00045CD7D6|nr:AAA family ATPase [Virgibacillus halodenitrificans]CDQ31912.1 5-methylcytosine-specific restriction enzyme B [Virgibacillus halodenitrificans]